MSNLKKKLNDIIQDIDKNVKNKDDLEYIKSQIYNVSMLFLDEIDKLAELNLGRLNVMLEREKELSKRIAGMEKVISNIEKEMFITDESDFEITCPYCNEEFIEDFTDGMKGEVKCPECGNIIELDWHEDEECNGGCNHNCHDCENNEEDINENEDDM